MTSRSLTPSDDGTMNQATPMQDKHVLKEIFNAIEMSEMLARGITHALDDNDLRKFGRLLMTESFRHNISWRFAQMLLAHEVATALDVNVLFRVDSFATRVLRVCTEVGLEGAVRDGVAPLLRKFLRTQKGDMELDPAKCPSLNMETRLLRVQAYLSVVEDMVRTLYVVVKCAGSQSFLALCRSLATGAASYFPSDENAARNVVLGTIFLRYLCPALINPDSKLRLATKHAKEHSQRTCMLLSKILQVVVNRKPPNEQYLQEFSYLMENQARWVIVTNLFLFLGSTELVEGGSFAGGEFTLPAAVEKKSGESRQWVSKMSRQSPLYIEGIPTGLPSPDTKADRTQRNASGPKTPNGTSGMNRKSSGLVVATDTSRSKSAAISGESLARLRSSSASDLIQFSQLPKSTKHASSVPSSPFPVVSGGASPAQLLSPVFVMKDDVSKKEVVSANYQMARLITKNCFKIRIFLKNQKKEHPSDYKQAIALLTELLETLKFDDDVSELEAKMSIRTLCKVPNKRQVVTGQPLLSTMAVSKWGDEEVASWLDANNLLCLNDSITSGFDILNADHKTLPCALKDKKKFREAQAYTLLLTKDPMADCEFSSPEEQILALKTSLAALRAQS